MRIHFNKVSSAFQEEDRYSHKTNPKYPVLKTNTQGGFRIQVFVNGGGGGSWGEFGGGGSVGGECWGTSWVEKLMDHAEAEWKIAEGISREFFLV
jgi:hypothetical protein